MSKKVSILIAFFALSSLAVGAMPCFMGIHPPKDRITDLNYPPEFFCDSGENQIDFQTDGERIAPEIKRFFGFVPAESIVRVFEKHGFSAKAYHGDVDTLKQRVSGRVPVIVFLSVPGDTHYAVVVGYDTQYFYLADSLPENKNADGNQYNRKLTIEDFEKIWKTDTVVLNNVYIVVDSHNSKNI